MIYFVLILFYLGIVAKASLYQYIFGHKNTDDISNSNSNHYNITTEGLKWNNHKYIFVGGLHSSGTSIMERLISSQKIASGLRVATTAIEDRSECLKAPIHSKYCIAPQDEGSFVTRAFQYYLNNDHDSNNFECNPSNPLHSWGHCSKRYHIGIKDIQQLHFNMKKHKKDKPVKKMKQHKIFPDALYSRKENKILMNSNTFRNRLLFNWNMFWNIESPYLVEKDIPNGVRSLLMQDMFTRDKTAFVFMMKHPLASCKNFICDDVVQHVVGWISYYSTLVEDLPYLSHYIVIHYEGLLKYSSNKKIINDLRYLLGWEDYEFRYGFDDGVLLLEPMRKESENNMDGKEIDEFMSGYNNIEHRRVTGYKTYKNGQLVPSGNDINPNAIAYIQASNAAVEWEMHYNYQLLGLKKDNHKLYVQLMKLEKKLNRFCYSLWSLQPICKLKPKLTSKSNSKTNNKQSLHFGDIDFGNDVTLDDTNYIYMRSKLNLPKPDSSILSKSNSKLNIKNSKSNKKHSDIIMKELLNIAMKE